eukprot:scaffold7153_cov255-Prasinococcus_capsulatus_cf.AAC.1
MGVMDDDRRRRVLGGLDHALARALYPVAGDGKTLFGCVGEDVPQHCEGVAPSAATVQGALQGPSCGCVTRTAS